MIHYNNYYEDFSLSIEHSIQQLDIDIELIREGKLKGSSTEFNGDHETDENYLIFEKMKFKELLSLIELTKALKRDICVYTNRIYKRFEVRRALGCKHYVRGAGIICPDCGEFTACRLCHYDEKGHSLNRLKISEIVCYFCGKRGPFGKYCSHCGKEVAKVLCNKCHFLNSESYLWKPNTHCDICGCCICNFPWKVVHCSICNRCHNKELHEKIRVVQQADCPICCEPLADNFSLNGIIVLRCGHQLHSTCYCEMFKTQNFKCPLCRKLIFTEETKTSMMFDDETISDPRTMYNDEMKKLIEESPEAKLDYKVDLYCNECGYKYNDYFNCIGYICPKCGNANVDPVS